MNQHNDRMVVTKIKGGLGNQLFQYAAGLSLASSRGVSLKLDLSYFKQKNIPGHSIFSLDKFYTDYQVAQPGDLKLFKPERHSSFFMRIFNLMFPSIRNSNTGCLFVEKYFHYDKEFNDLPKKVMLDGYWQTEKYFSDISKLLRDNFVPKFVLSSGDICALNKIKKFNSVSIHIRRGDYVTNIATNKYHGVCEIEYYQRAIEYLEKKVKNPVFFVFSDDIVWAQKNLGFLNNKYFIDHNDETYAAHDLYLMSLCQHHVIANSSFSWWGAWLSKNPQKKVIAPRRWFRDSSIDTSDLIPDNWIRL